MCIHRTNSTELYEKDTAQDLKSHHKINDKIETTFSVPFLLCIFATTMRTSSFFVPFLGAIMAKSVSASVVLSKEIMELAKTGAILSKLAYDEDPKGEEYGRFGFYDAEPDQALVAQRDGYCFGAFRGTTLTWIDWQQNFDPHSHDICDNTGCCKTRKGFYDAYMTDYRQDFEDAIRACAKECDNADECVVLTGHSQGGAIAAVAALFLADLNPYVFTFGQPTTIDAPCDKVTSARWFRFVNTKESDLVGISYDPVPFVSGLGADSFGHMILLSNGVYEPTDVTVLLFAASAHILTNVSWTCFI